MTQKNATSQKPALVLLPGVLNDKSLWQYQISNLSPHLDIIVPELYHESSVSLLAERVIQEIDSRSHDTFFLAGLSMGGYVACEVMRQAGHRVQKLMMLNTSLRADTPAHSAFRQKLIKQSYLKGFKGMTPRLLPSVISPYHLNNETITSCVLAMAETFTGEEFRNQQEATINRPDSRQSIEQYIKCPTLAVGGEDDEVTPIFLQAEMKRLIPSARLEILEQCGHLSPLEQPEKVNAFMHSWFLGE
jgi:pimeloyl-ACP methyl ester carboxylesterase